MSQQDTETWIRKNEHYAGDLAVVVSDDEQKRVTVRAEDYSGSLTASLILNYPEDIVLLGQELLKAALTIPVEVWTNDSLREQASEDDDRYQVRKERDQLSRDLERTKHALEREKRLTAQMSETETRYFHELTRVADDPARALSLRERGVVR